MLLASSLSSEPLPSHREGWIVHVTEETASTNSAAAPLPPFHALRARVQTGGRGRTGRAWVSDEGGLWLSAVLPCPGDRARWSVLPLAAGWAIIGALKELGAAGLRLRWPNDIMAGPRKLAGILVERYARDTAVVGIGMNVFNTPETADPALSGTTTRLADLVSAPATLDDLTGSILRALGRAHALIRDDRFQTIVYDLNRQWSQPRTVALELTVPPHTITGRFTGIDANGRLRIVSQRFGTHYYDAAQVSLLRELDETQYP